MLFIVARVIETCEVYHDGGIDKVERGGSFIVSYGKAVVWQEVFMGEGAQEERVNVCGLGHTVDFEECGGELLQNAIDRLWYCGVRGAVISGVLGAKKSARFFECEGEAFVQSV